MKAFGVIYRVTNMVNGKIYVGQTIGSLSRRWSVHKSDSKRLDYPLYKAMRKYGAASFSLMVIGVGFDREGLDSMENYLIKAYGSLDRNIGYNLRPLARGPGSMSEDGRKRISEFQSGRKQTPAQRAAASINLKKCQSPEANAKRSASLKGRRPCEQSWELSAAVRRTPEHRARMSAKFKGKVPTVETCAKISAALKGKPKSAEHVEKVRQALIERHLRLST